MSRRSDTLAILHLRAEPAGNDRLGRHPTYRLCVALKVLLRTFGLRCTRIDYPGGEQNAEALEVSTKAGNE